jgi:hypothetical protein
MGTILQDLALPMPPVAQGFPEEVILERKAKEKHKRAHSVRQGEFIAH